MGSLIVKNLLISTYFGGIECDTLMCTIYLVIVGKALFNTTFVKNKSFNHECHIKQFLSQRLYGLQS